MLYGNQLQGRTYRGLDPATEATEKPDPDGAWRGSLLEILCQRRREKYDSSLFSRSPILCRTARAAQRLLYDAARKQREHQAGNNVTRSIRDRQPVSPGRWRLFALCPDAAK